MTNEAQGEFRGARAPFGESVETFYERHDEGTNAPAESEGEEQSNRIDEAIKTEERAISQTDDAIEMRRGALDEQRRQLENLGGEDSNPTE